MSNPIAFVKMHGCGNDFVIIDARYHDPCCTRDDIVRMSNRHTGIGCDQFIILKPASAVMHDVDMVIYNNDGSVAESCGNATRCVAELILQEKNNHECTINTLGGARHCIKQHDMIIVNMGAVSYKPNLIPLGQGYNSPILNIHPEFSTIYAVNVGNPHAVILLDDDVIIDDALLRDVGVYIQTHDAFPQSVNVEFVQKTYDNHYRVRVWERGAGITLACGSGASAVHAILHKVQPNIDHTILHMDGGDLYMHHDDHHNIMMQGPTEILFAGSWLVNSA